MHVLYSHAACEKDLLDKYECFFLVKYGISSTNRGRSCDQCGTVVLTHDIKCMSFSLHVINSKNNNKRMRNHLSALTIVHEWPIYCLILHKQLHILSSWCTTVSGHCRCLCVSQSCCCMLVILVLLFFVRTTNAHAKTSQNIEKAPLRHTNNTHHIASCVVHCHCNR